MAIGEDEVIKFLGNGEEGDYLKFSITWARLGREWYHLMKRAPIMRAHVKETLAGIAEQLRQTRETLEALERKGKP